MLSTPPRLQPLELFGGRRRLRDDAPEVGRDRRRGRGEDCRPRAGPAPAPHEDAHLQPPEALPRSRIGSSSPSARRERRARELASGAGAVAGSPPRRSRSRPGRRSRSGSGPGARSRRRHSSAGFRWWSVRAVAHCRSSGRRWRWLGYPAGRSRCRRPPSPGPENSRLDCLPPSLKPRCCHRRRHRRRRCWSAWSAARGVRLLRRRFGLAAAAGPIIRTAAAGRLRHGVFVLGNRRGLSEHGKTGQCQQSQH